jgi:hypothetical protein
MVLCGAAGAVAFYRLIPNIGGCAIGLLLGVIVAGVVAPWFGKLIGSDSADSEDDFTSN